MVAADIQGRTGLQRRRLRRAALGALMMAGSAASAMAVPAYAQEAARNFDIPTQPLATALTAFGQQSGLQVSTKTPLVEGKSSSSVKGALSPMQALSQLLAGTGLSFRVVGSTVMLEPPPQPVAGAIQLGPVRVEGEGDNLGYYGGRYAGIPETARGPVDGYVATRSATATKTDTPITEIPMSISIVTADRIQDQGSLRISDAMRYTAGVRYQEYGIGNRGDLFTLRGGSSGSTLLDGLRLPQGANYGYTRNIPYNYERVEVLRGPASLMSGQNGPGGVINLVSKRPLAESRSEIGVQLGNYGHKQIQADLTGPLDSEGKFLYRLVAVGTDSGTQVRYADEKRFLIAPSFTWRPNDGTKLTLFGEYQEDRTNNVEAYLPTVGSLYDAPHGKVPTNLNINEPSWDRFDGTRKRVGLEFEQQLSDQWSLRGLVRHDDNGPGEYYSMYAVWWQGFRDANGNADPDGKYMNRRYFLRTEKRRDTNANVLLEGAVSTGPLEHTLLFGADGLWSRSIESSDGGVGTPLNVYDPVYGSFPEPVIADPEERIKARNIGVFIQDQIRISDRLTVLAGVRFDWAETNTRAQDQKDDAVSKNFGLVWTAGGGFSPYASYTESFEPTLGYGQKADGSLLKPKRGKQFEAGLKWLSPDQNILATAAIYRLKEKNRPGRDSDNPDYFTELGEITAKGVELEVAANLAHWDLTAQYTYTDARITETIVPRELDVQLRGQPKNSAAFWAVHRFDHFGLAGLRAGLGLRYSGPTSTGFAEGPTVPSVTLLDAMIGYDVGRWRFAFNVSNLTDKTYVVSCQEGVGAVRCWPGDRRRATGSLTYRF